MYYATMQPDQLREDDFIDIYPKEEILADKKHVLEIIKKNKEEQPDNGAIVLENIVQDKGHEWFGENVHFVLLSDYDDRGLESHSDVVMEIKRNGKIIRIMIDLTTSTDAEDINKKMNRSEVGIKNGNLSSVKYFSSKAESYRKKLSNVPRVVCGVHDDRLIEACKNIAGDKTVVNLIPFILLEEALGQLIYMESLANKNAHFSDNLKDKIIEAKEAISELRAKKKTLLTSNDEQRAFADAVYKKIRPL